jgi:hypothetical protein
MLSKIIETIKTEQIIEQCLNISFMEEMIKIISQSILCMENIENLTWDQKIEITHMELIKTNLEYKVITIIMENRKEKGLEI